MIPISSLETQAKAAADKFRRTHELGEQPLGDLVALVEFTAKCDVAILDAPDDEHGMTMRDPEREVAFIGVARSRNPMRQRSTLAHELGHVIFADWDAASNLSERSPQEIRADAFARHLLIPIDGLKAFLGKRPNISEAQLSDVVQHFLVSPQIAAIALRQSGYIDADTFAAWMGLRTPQLASRYGWRDYYAALQEDSYRVRAPQQLLARAITGYVDGVVSAQTIATLRRLPVEQVIEELEFEGITPTLDEPADVDINRLRKVDVDLSDLEDEDPDL